MALLSVPLIYMKINENYRLEYELDNIFVQKNENGEWKDLAPINESAAMVWEGIERGIARNMLIQAVVNEFDGADEATVAADLDTLITQLKNLGIIED